jgi:endonuclease/exonuclease/phosphatase family metal-dependent hydrolase
MQHTKRKARKLVDAVSPYAVSTLLRENKAYRADGHDDGDVDTVLASYNIHKAVGLDGRFDPRRITSVIREMNADVVAVQEANKRFGARSCLLDFDIIRHECGLIPVPLVGEDRSHGWHGNLLLFRNGEVTDARWLNLPGIEPRGAVMVDLSLEAGPLRIIAAHLGLLRRCRTQQVETLLSLAEPEDGRATLLMGDLNEWRVGERSALRKLEPAFGPLHATVPSFPSRFPVLALDRVLAKPHNLISSVELHDTPLARIASDHLPIKAGVKLAAATRARDERALEEAA